MVAIARHSIGRSFFCGLFGALTACSSEATEPEQFPTTPGGGGASQITGVPAGWSGGAVRPNEYEIGRDVQVVHGGSASAYLRSRDTVISPGSFVSLTQGLRGNFIRGQRVRLSGYIKTSAVAGDGVGLWLRVDAATRTRGFDNMTGRRRLGTRDWEYAEVVLDVPDDALGVFFGALLNGTGTGWVDDLKFETVGPEVPVTAPVLDGPATNADTASVIATYDRLLAEPANLDFEGIVLAETQAAAVDWARSKSSSFETDDPAAADADLAPLRAIIGNAGLVALGESTHGTRQFFRMKHRVFQYLVQHLGFDHFSIEASLPEALVVDRYVQTGVGDPAAVVRGMGFWTWSTEEVIDLVRWMRSWNAGGGTPRVRFTGFDMQNPRVAIDSVVAFAGTIDQALGDTVRSAYGCLNAGRIPGSLFFSTDGYRQLTLEARAACRASVSGIDSLFVRRMSEWTAGAGAERVRLMQRLARLVSQWEEYALGGSRDRYMAENAAWWKAHNGGRGMMLWAHNAHVSRQSQWMGGELKRLYGADYLNMALTFSAGSFNAIEQLPSGAFGQLRAHQAAGAWPGSFEALMDATGRERAIFDARATLADPVGQSLRRRLTIRFIGSGFSPTLSLGAYQAPMALPEDFDVIIWFRNATASRLSLASIRAQDAISLSPFASMP